MIWTQEKGKQADAQITQRMAKACAEHNIPFGILAGTCECESNFRLGIVSSAGALGPFQILPKYREDYIKYAGFEFDIETWDSIEGVAAAFATFAGWGRKRGHTGDDVWRFALETFRWGQNSDEANFKAPQKRVLDVEAHMRRNGLWYNTDLDGDQMDDKYYVPGATGFVDKMINWMLDNGHLKYDQPKRMQKGYADCSSFVFRAAMAAGKKDWCNKTSSAPTSSEEVYDSDFELLWPSEYASIGKAFLPASQLAKYREKGLILFTNTISTGRANKITHVSTLLGDGKMIQTANAKNNVEIVAETKYKNACAILRYNPNAPLRKGQKGARVKALQKELNAKGAGLTVDGEYGAKTEAAVNKYASTPEVTPGKIIKAVVTASQSLNVRTKPDASSRIVDTVHRGDMLKLYPAAGGWHKIAEGTHSGCYVSAKYIREV